MLSLIAFIAGVLLGFGLYKLIERHEAEIEEEAPGETLIERQAREKRDNLARIMLLFEDKKQISNDDVEESLNVSDATATNYLDELEAMDKIRQVGKTGRNVHYELVSN